MSSSDLLTSEPRNGPPLPFEIWGAIFECVFLAAQISDENWASGQLIRMDTVSRSSLFRISMTAHYPLRIVCSAWNAVVLSTAPLWTTITVYREDERAPEIAQMAVLRHLELSNGHPLRVTLWGRYDWRASARNDQFTALIDTLFSQSARFISLELIRTGINILITLPSNLCSLQSFVCLQASRRFRDESNFLAALKAAPLRRLRITVSEPVEPDMQAILDNVDWRKLDSLACSSRQTLLHYLANPASGPPGVAGGVKCVELFTLVEYTAHQDLVMCTALRLEVLKLDGRNKNWHRMLEALAPPALQLLAIYNNCTFRGNLQVVGHHLAQHYVSVTTLALHYIADVSSTSLACLLGNLPALAVLDLKERSHPVYPLHGHHLLAQLMNLVPRLKRNTAPSELAFARLKEITYELDDLPLSLAQDGGGPTSMQRQLLLDTITSFVEYWGNVPTIESVTVAQRTFTVHGLELRNQLANHSVFLQQRRKWVEEGRLVVEVGLT
ncbi:hypothetical protein MIND_00288900 [Mycena indigotica]|uniref:F-box domain-containing protein n=1 Tax=Mycena indigotica TaxID=2126181 RepID=A0A8H6T8J1_9AGAR|nr:uncharacterized protein MIND_00288900 [Mycena indigotica]KAF7312739.1 hypothetical protein MIND_00288900 [Mycena indigotica]